jgi:hypothetical protein
VPAHLSAASAQDDERVGPRHGADHLRAVTDVSLSVCTWWRSMAHPWNVGPGFSRDLTTAAQTWLRLGGEVDGGLWQ